MDQPAAQVDAARQSRFRVRVRVRFRVRIRVSRSPSPSPNPNPNAKAAAIYCVVYKHATEFCHDRYAFAWNVAGDYLCYLNLTLTLTLTLTKP